MSADDINQLFWLRYAQAIKDKLDGNWGANEALFIASEARPAPPAPGGVPEAYTNKGIYDAANSLLAADSLFSKHSGMQGYAQTLPSYLNWADLGGRSDPGMDRLLENARRDAERYQDQYNAVQEKAIARFRKDQEYGMSSSLNFGEWLAQGRAPDYSAANQQLQMSEGMITNLQSNMDGPSAGNVNNSRGQVGRGLDVSRESPGFTMRIALADNTTEVLRAQAENERMPTPAYRLVPLYTVPSYEHFARDYQKNSGSQPNDAIEFSINIGDDPSKFSFGQTSTTAARDGPAWLGFRAPGEDSERLTMCDLGGDASAVRVKMLFDKIQLIEIRRGNWDIDFNQIRLRGDAPANLKNLARPTRMVVAARLGFEISFGSESARKFDSMFQPGGSMRVLGISTGTESDTHKVNWDSSSKTLRVVPKDDVPTTTVLGVVAQKVSPS
ncbi:hypothetical protein Micbo1qcDRAFT_208734 [Microdochium bolleyi]|uniref:Uncharacterized protein n=1 Tax=Microdochium bolleyi TaxID=196109 RepID=A0A136IPW2_9PEZI|nr:hypothetical protein Micbo1qcDRAFT_208734 [Microdochium bolleyi]